MGNGRDKSKESGRDEEENIKKGKRKGGRVKEREIKRGRREIRD